MNNTCYIGSLTAFSAAIEVITDNQTTALYRGQPNLCCKLLPQIARGQSKHAKIEAEMLNYILNYGLDYIDLEDPSACQLLIEAHNAGLQTRLLDWTINAYEALWFACHSAGAQPLVYALNTADLPQLSVEEDPFAITRTHMMPLSENADDHNKRLTVHPARKEHEHLLFTPLEDEPAMYGALTKMLVLPESKVKIIQELNDIGINEHSIYQNLVGLCRHVNLIFDGGPSGLMSQQAQKCGETEEKGRLGLQQFKSTYLPDFDFD